jgi:hypothetical protein
MQVSGCINREVTGERGRANGTAAPNAEQKGRRDGQQNKSVKLKFDFLHSKKFKLLTN